MKTALLVLIGMVIPPSLSRAALTSYNMEVGYQDHSPPSFLAAHVTATDFSGNNGYQGYTGGASGSGVIDNGWAQVNQTIPPNYFTFTLQADAGYELDISGFTFYERRYAVDRLQWALRSSLDSFASDLGGGSASAGFVFHNITFSFNDITAPVEFRLYAYNAVSNLGDQWVVDDVSVLGTVSGIPEPNVAFVIAASVAGVAFRRTRLDRRPL